MNKTKIHKAIKQEIKNRNISYNQLIEEKDTDSEIRMKIINKVKKIPLESGESEPTRAEISQQYDKVCKNILEEKKGNRMVWSIKLIIASIVISIILFLINFYIKP
jgi:hypothetical protein